MSVNRKRARRRRRKQRAKARELEILKRIETDAEEILAAGRQLGLRRSFMSERAEAFRKAIRDSLVNFPRTVLMVQQPPRQSDMADAIALAFTNIKDSMTKALDADKIIAIVNKPADRIGFEFTIDVGGDRQGTEDAK